MLWRGSKCHHLWFLEHVIKIIVQGCENFVLGLAQLLCLALPGSCLVRFTYLFVPLCTWTSSHRADVVRLLLPIFANWFFSLLPLVYATKGSCDQSPWIATLNSFPTTQRSHVLHSLSRAPRCLWKLFGTSLLFWFPSLLQNFPLSVAIVSMAKKYFSDSKNLA